MKVAHIYYPYFIVSIHQKKLLLTDIYKTFKNLKLTFMTEVVVTKDVPYNLRDNIYNLHFCIQHTPLHNKLLWLHYKTNAKYIK